MRGGKREGSGRKKNKIETTTICFRLSVYQKSELKKNYKNLNTLFVQFTKYLKDEGRMEGH